MGFLPIKANPYPTDTLAHSGFSAANGLSGISTKKQAVVAEFKNSFQCRERPEWDFYGRTPGSSRARSVSFSAANGLSGISTRSPSEARTYAKKGHVSVPRTA